MKEKSRCSILFHLEVPGGRWRMISVRPVSSARSLLVMKTRSASAIWRSASGAVSSCCSALTASTSVTTPGYTLGFSDRWIHDDLTIAGGTGVDILDGHGITGDRYENARHRQVTVQTLEEIAAAEAEVGRSLDAVQTRRNITLSGGRLDRTPGARIVIGEGDGMDESLKANGATVAAEIDAGTLV